jgi:hypothetical protein
MVMFLFGCLCGSAGIAALILYRIHCSMVGL